MKRILKAEYLGYGTYRLEVGEELIEMLKEQQLDMMIESAKKVETRQFDKRAQASDPDGFLMRMNINDVSDYTKNYQTLYMLLRDAKEQDKKEGHPAETEGPF